ncbi:MAG: helix-turn-helix transcriptional regulator [Bacteroidales bacterium]|nr:helix-turn-helix transcriptional regulator [Candidatus Physcousia equi]
MLYNITLLPVYGAILYAIRGELRLRHRMGGLLMTLIGLMFVLRFLCIGLQFEGQTLSDFMMWANSMSLVYIFPLSYMFLCDQCGTKCYNGAALFMLLLPLVLLAHIDLPIPVESVVCIAQCLVIAWRMWVLYERVKDYGLKFSARLMNYFVWMFVLLVANIFFQMQREWIDGAEWQHWLFFVIYSLVCTWGFVLVPSSFRVSPIVTKEDEQPVRIDTFIQNTAHLAQRIHQLFDEERIYLRQGLVIDDAARLVGTNRTYITRLMRQEYGRSFTEHVNLARIENAKLLLKDEQWSLEDIAMKSGFSNASAFCRTFKRYTGETPTQWRHAAPFLKNNEECTQYNEH